KLGKRVMYPFARPRLDCSHEVRHGGVRSPAEVHVQVIFDAADLVEHALLGSHDPADIGIQTSGNVRGDPRDTTLRGEDNVQEKLGVCAWHRDPRLSRPSGAAGCSDGWSAA